MAELIGDSRWARQMRASIAQVAGCRANVLVTGPSGTGKELIARAIHQQSRRADAPFVAVDCTSIPPSLFSSQLFGHVKGAFSGADCDTLGGFRAADGGTIFLDEIGELNLELQSHLLRAIQERTVIPIGSHQGIPIDVRIVAATSRRLGEEVNAGRFRLDLYYRLNVVRLETMPLCRHPEDVELLCRHFLNRLSVENGLPQKKVSPSGIRALSALHWPGNVRQLQNVLERAVVFVAGDDITERHVTRLLEAEWSPPPTGTPGACVARQVDTGSRGGLPMSWGASSRAESPSWPSLAESEHRLIEEALERTFYNQSAAARLLDVDRRLLARKIRKYGIAMPSRRRPAHSG